MIRTTKNVEIAMALTHGGVFHADEVFASVVLSYTVKEMIVARVTKIPDSCEKLVYDIGDGKYDHHQNDKKYRADGLPYAAAGLIWRDYGEEALRQMGIEEELLPKVWKQVDDSLFKGIDAADNGVSMNGTYENMSVSAIISMYNPLWDECKETDEAFLEACAMAEHILKRIVDNIASEIRGMAYVKKAMSISSGRTVILEKFVPWQRCVCTEDPDNRFWYVVYPSNRGGYNVQCVPDKPASFNMRHGLPESWRGLRDNQLRQISGVKDAIFVHSAGFIGAAESMEGAVMMAEKAANMWTGQQNE